MGVTFRFCLLVPSVIVFAMGVRHGTVSAGNNPVDCDALVKIRQQIIDLEISQWQRSFEIVERRLSL